MIRVYMILQDTNAYNYCTYLNNGLLEAPREYVLHGLVPGLNWAPFWPLPMSMHLVASPSPVSGCLLQRFKFHTQRLLLSGWLLTDVQVDITTTLHDAWHTCIYITLALLFILSSYTSSILLGRLAVPDSYLLLHYCPASRPDLLIWGFSSDNDMLIFFI